MSNFQVHVLWTFSNKPCWFSDNVLEFVFFMLGRFGSKKTIGEKYFEMQTHDGMRSYFNIIRYVYEYM